MHLTTHQTPSAEDILQPSHVVTSADLEDAGQSSTPSGPIARPSYWLTYHSFSSQKFVRTDLHHGSSADLMTFHTLDEADRPDYRILDYIYAGAVLKRYGSRRSNDLLVEQYEVWFERHKRAVRQELDRKYAETRQRKANADLAREERWKERSPTAPNSPNVTEVHLDGMINHDPEKYDHRTFALSGIDNLLMQRMTEKEQIEYWEKAVDDCLKAESEAAEEVKTRAVNIVNDWHQRLLGDSDETH